MWDVDLNLIGRYVCINLSEREENGIVYSIDPDFGHVILIADDSTTIVCIGSSIQSLQILNNEIDPEIQTVCNLESTDSQKLLQYMGGAIESKEPISFIEIKENLVYIIQKLSDVSWIFKI